MSEREQRQAQQTDRYLDELQSGKQGAPPPDLLAGEAELLASLVSVAEAHPPDPAFVAGLEDRVRAAGHIRSKREHSLLSRIGTAAVKMGRGYRHVALPAIGLVAVVAVAIAVAAVLLNRGGQPAKERSLVQQPTTPPPAEVETRVLRTASATPRPTETPRVAGPKERPSSTPTAGVPPSPTPTAAPTTLPTVSAWPRLAALIGGGFGGGGLLPKVTFVLEAALSDGVEQVPVYVQGEPEPLTAQAAKQAAENLGLEATIFMPRWMTGPEAAHAARKSYVGIDDPHQVVFEGTEMFHYLDRQRTPYRAGHWYPPENLVPQEQAMQAATAFLKAAGLLDVPYQATASGDTIRFTRTIDEQWRMAEPFAVVAVWTDGQVGGVTYRHVELIEAGTYPILSTREAWDILSQQEADGRVWVTQRAERTPWGEWDHNNPKYWARTYSPGQRAELFGAPQVWYPAEEGGSLYVAMNGLVLTGDVEPLARAHQAVVDALGDVQTTLHVWGTVRDAGGYPALRVEGWKAAPRVWWAGTIQRQSGQGLLQTEDGRTVQVPDLPPDLVDGSAVYVEGGQVAERLEWYVIQERPADGDLPHGGDPAAEVQAVVERIELVYLAPRLDAMAPEWAADPGYRSVQPVWRFSGHTGQGSAFEAYVQALREEELRE